MNKASDSAMERDWETHTEHGDRRQARVSANHAGMAMPGFHSVPRARCGSARAARRQAPHASAALRPKMK